MKFSSLIQSLLLMFILLCFLILEFQVANGGRMERILGGRIGQQPPSPQGKDGIHNND
ncbi:hypothetical protein IHE45_05G137400 [Dioscorea alata]|uniref:Uncharacterized protein n=1 Tax=Dioscorea alata TaxID=55571 RepID=A0ACB7W589_DIOAL|nr:hypothetical protein IHE45_05G137400 [Dioscorea alata]